MLGSCASRTGGLVLCRGLDRERDQSYFLYSLSRYQLEHTLFPLHNLRKDQVRHLAHHYSLPVANKPSSQDICFVGRDGYQSFLRRRCPKALSPGPIVDTQGRVIGWHRGVGAYTIGQRRGLGVATGERLYVVALDAKHNRVLVGPQH